MKPTMTQEQLLLAVCSFVVLLLVFAGPLFLKNITKFSLRFSKKKSKDGIWISSSFLDDEDRLRHTHIVGATGCGKTVLLEQLIYRDIERGLGAVIVDAKGDREFFDRLKIFCRAIGREGDLKLLSATHQMESVGWNPCRLGTPTELQSKFMQAAIYSEPHYEKACELALLKAFNELNESGEPFSLENLVDRLRILSRDGKDETTAGLFLDLNNLMLGPWGPILSGSSDKEEVDLLKIVRSNEILFVDLPTEAQAVQSARIGRLLLQEIILTSGLRKLYPHLKSGRPFSVYVDEFDAFAFPHFTTFLNKGRSSDFMIHLSHQTLSDLDKVSPSFKGQIVSNMNVRFIFRQDNPDDAESWSRFFGTKTAVKQTFQTKDGSNTGLSSNRLVQEFRVSPDTIKELKTGECFLGIKTAQQFRKLKIPFGSKSHIPRFAFPNLRQSQKNKSEDPPKDALTRSALKKTRLLSAERDHKGESNEQSNSISDTGTVTPRVQLPKGTTKDRPRSI